MDLPADFTTQVENLSIEKRDYQISATEEIINALPNSVLLNYPYGTGKTVVALLTFLVLKKSNPKAKFVFTSAREAATLRCRQALEMAKDFGFLEQLGYLYDPKGAGLSLAQKRKMYSYSDAIFSPITPLVNDRFEIKSRFKEDILEGVQLCVVDEATDLLARSMTGFRLSKYFEELLHIRSKGNKFPILGLSGTRDQTRAKAIVKILGEGTLLMQNPELSPYETITQMHAIHREDYAKLDHQIGHLMTKPVEIIQEILEKKLSRLEIIKMAYGGVLDRLYAGEGKLPISIGDYVIKEEEQREKLLQAFLRLFKLTHARLLLLESIPGEFLKYINSDENKEIFRSLSTMTQDFISHRAELVRFDNPEEKVVRGLLHPKITVATELIREHLTRGAKILLFTRYIAVGEQVYRLLQGLGFPGVGFLSGKSPEDSRRITLKQFQQEDLNVLVFTPVGGRGLNLGEADIVVHLDITTNLDDMVQRRERARGCLEYVLVLKDTSEEGKVQEYAKMSKELTKESDEAETL